MNGEINGTIRHSWGCTDCGWTNSMKDKTCLHCDTFYGKERVSQRMNTYLQRSLYRIKELRERGIY